MEQIKIKKVEGLYSKLPAKQTEGASCYDAYAREVEVRPDGLIIYRLGFETEIPPHMEGIVIARSNLTKHPFVMANGIGEIDSDFRDEWEFRIRPLVDRPSGFHPESIGTFSRKHMPYYPGDRCCQIKFKKKDEVELVEVDELSETKRAGGFGSTKQ